MAPGELAVTEVSASLTGQYLEEAVERRTNFPSNEVVIRPRHTKAARMTALQIWLLFAACAVTIGLAGPVLVRSGARIACLTGLSQSWTGVVLLATATSLPELFTGLSAVTVASAPNIAVGDVLGSCLFNLLLLVILDAFSREGSIYSRVEQGHILTAAFGVVLIGFVGAILLFGRSELDLRVGHVSIYTPILALVYFAAARALFCYERKSNMAGAPIDEGEGQPLRRAVKTYLIAALFVAVAGTLLPFAGLELAATMGWGTSFVGSLFVAAATSLPELVVVISALRLRAVEMAVGGLLGSNLFDVLILAIDDIAYVEGSLLARASPVHAGSAFVAVIMSGVVIVGLLYRPRLRFFGIVTWISLALLVLYVMSSYAMFLLGE